MKKIKITLASLALALGIVTAFAFTPATSVSSADPVYKWDVDNQNHTVAEARIAFDCPQGDNTLCATGMLVSGSGPSPLQIKKP